MKDVQYIKGNRKSLIALILFLVCWILIGVMVKQYREIRIEEINQIQDVTVLMQEMRSVHVLTVILPGVLFFAIITALSAYIGFLTLKQKQYPPTGIHLPFKTELVKGEKAKSSSYGYLFSACISLIMIFLISVSWIVIEKICSSVLIGG